MPLVPARDKRAALDNADPLQLLQACRQQRLRHEWHAAPDVAETRAPGEQFVNDERGPALGDDLRRLGYRAELAISHHRCTFLAIASRHHSASALPRRSRFWSGCGRYILDWLADIDTQRGSVFRG